MKKRLLAGLMAVTLTISGSMSVVAAESISEPVMTSITEETQAIPAENLMASETEETQATQAENLTASETEDMQLDNLTAEFTKLDGTKATSTAQGKPKVLIFFSATCSNCRYTISDISSSSWLGSGIADIVAVDMNYNSKADVEAFKTSYGSDAIAICYDEGYTANGVAWDYVRLCEGGTSITFPLIFYIDANNKVRGYSTGWMSADSVKERIEAISPQEVEPTPTPTPDAGSFADVSANAWYAASVNWAYENGVMSGVGNNNFNPTGYTDRAMVVQILYNISEKPSVSTAKEFTDVASNAWYANAVQWAAGTGVTSGVSATEFAPTRNVTRQEVAVFLYQYAKRQGYDTTGRNDLSSYSDSSQVASWAKEAMQWANNAGIINGKGTTNPLLDPQGTATRAEIATMMKGFMTNGNSSTSQLSYEEQVVALVNAERAKENLAPLTMTESLKTVAEIRAEETTVLFSHDRPNGSSCFSILSEYGISYRAAGENIAWGQKTPEIVVDAWMNSPGHRANIMSSNFGHIGVGYYVKDNVAYWVQLFTN